MSIVILPYGMPEQYGVVLADLPIQSSLVFGDEAPDICTLADLTAKDDLILVASSKALTASRQRLRCRVSILLQEPYAIKPRFHRFCRLYAGQYHRVLTHSTSLLSSIRNARFAAHGGAFVNSNVNPDDEKTGRVSLIASAKKSTAGHKLRHRIASWSFTNAADLALFGSGYNRVDDKSDAHAPYLFSVVIENSRAAGYFTEKLIDSFLSLSLPIYWGAPDITHFFDPRGMICCYSESEIRAAINRVGVDDFKNRLSYLVENQRRAKLFSDLYVNAARVLKNENETGDVF